MNNKLFEHIDGNQFRLTENNRFQAKQIKVNGQIIPVNPKNGDTFTVEELKKYIGGGYIQMIVPPGKTGAIMIIDEDGKMKGFPTNKLATQMWQEFAFAGSPRTSDNVVGDVLLLHRSQMD